MSQGGYCPYPVDMPSKTDLAERAYGAWIKYRRGHGPPPTMSATTVEEHGGLTYVILRRDGQVVDVYRYLEQEDSLKRLNRYYPWGRKRAAA